MALLTWDTDIVGNRWDSSPYRAWDSELFLDSVTTPLTVDEGNVYLAQVQDEFVLLASNLSDSALFGYLIEMYAEENLALDEAPAYGFIGIWDEGINGFFPSSDAVCSELCCDWVEEDTATGCPGE